MLARLLLVISLLLLLPASALAQPDGEATEETELEAESDQEPPDDEAAPVEEPEVVKAVEPHALFLAAENTARARTNRIAMLTLGGWALANFGWATVGLLRSPEEREQSFHLANAGWNLFNMGVAVTGYFSNLDDDWSDRSAMETLNKNHGAEKLYLVRAALDLAIIATGAFLTAKGNLDKREGMVGTGRSFMLQGAVLFVFDASMFGLHSTRSDFMAKLEE